MNQSLPFPPNLSHLKNRAKSLVKDHKRGDSAVCETLRRLRRFENALEREILDSRVALHEAQFALASQYGFTSWDALKRHVLLARSEAMPSPVRIEGNRVWIEGVPDPGLFARGDCSFAGALSAVLETTKRPFSYSDVMGYSGLAFRVRWFRSRDGKRWCPSSPVGEFPAEMRAVERCTGWRISDRSNMVHEDDPHMEEHAALVAESIRSGMPAIGYPKVGWALNLGVAYGFETDDDTIRILWKEYSSKEVSVPIEEVGPMLLFLSDDASSALEPREAFMYAIEGRWWRDDDASVETLTGTKGLYLLADRALAQWRDDIAESDGFSEEERESLFFVSWWCYTSLYDARKNAVAFLKSNAARFDEGVRSAIEQAAAVYENEVKLLARPFEEKNAFLGKWTRKKFADWDAECRRREIGILDSMRALDAQAIDSLKRVAIAWRETLGGL